MHEQSWQGIEYLLGEERTNYPLTLSVDDFGSGFRLTAHTVSGLDPARLCAMMSRSLESLVEALEREPRRWVCQLDVLLPEERQRLLVEWNETALRRIRRSAASMSCSRSRYGVIRMRRRWCTRSSH